MIVLKVDVAAIGAGFAGSIAAMLLARRGLSVALVEQGSHPRFAIGESSTPLADSVLRELARQYDLPRLQRLATYGQWKLAYPSVVCGPKRGFAYFAHDVNRPFTATADHATELMVAANHDEQNADTHWLREDVDTFLLSEAQRNGVVYLDETCLEWHGRSTNHVLCGTRNGESVEIHADFVIGATGATGVLPTAFDCSDVNVDYRTNTRAVFAHFRGVRRWRDVLSEAAISTADHPFDCDRAALHHVLDGGWMWQLWFDDGTVSAGFAIDQNRHPMNESLSAEAEWQFWLQQFPSIQQQFADAIIVRPSSGLIRIDRLQQPARRSVGDRWALLPGAVGFRDPLHSTGIAHSLFGVQRLAAILSTGLRASEFDARLQEYSRTIQAELAMIDRMVSLAYRSSHNFRLFVAATMPYFAAATTCERRRTAGDDVAFLLADDPAFGNALDQLEQGFAPWINSRVPTKSDLDLLEVDMACLLGGFDSVGLFNPPTPRMYHHTATK